MAQEKRSYVLCPLLCLADPRMSPDQREANPAPKPRSRRHRLIPIPNGPRDEFVVLDESDGMLGLVLWERVRDAYLWASVSADDRAGLFHAGGEESRGRLSQLSGAPELTESLALLGFMARFPQMANSASVAQGCMEVAAWAEASARFETAVLYAEAAAIAAPDDPHPSLTAGRLCRRIGVLSRASWWYLRGIGVARRARDREGYISGQLGYGGVLFQMGYHTRAKYHYRRAAGRAVWAGIDTKAAEAYHDLLTVATELGALDDGISAATNALQFYPIFNPRVPFFGHDVGYLMIRSGFFTVALSILDAARPLIAPLNRLLIWGTTARCCAAVGQEARYNEALAEVFALASATEEMASAAYVHAAEGARTLHRPDLAGELAQRAREIAGRRGEHALERYANALLGADAGQAPIDSNRAPPEGSGVEQLAAAVIARLVRQREARDDA
jgi:tetratricopeptide (TPR) repeat protein